MTVNKTLVTSSSEDSAVTAESTISGKTIIEAICEINGTFGNINREGKFEYVILKKITSALYPAEDLYCKFCSNGTPILKSAVHSF